MHAEDVDVEVFGDAFLDVGVEPDGELFAFLGGLGHVHHFGALGLGHLGGWNVVDVLGIIVFLVSNFLIIR